MPFFRRDKTRKLITEVEVVRTKITLACTECQRRNYNMTKDKKTSTSVINFRVLSRLKKGIKKRPTSKLSYYIMIFHVRQHLLQWFLWFFAAFTPNCEFLVKFYHIQGYGKCGMMPIYYSSRIFLGAKDMHLTGEHQNKSFAAVEKKMPFIGYRNILNLST